MFGNNLFGKINVMKTIFGNNVIFHQSLVVFVNLLTYHQLWSFSLFFRYFDRANYDVWINSFEWQFKATNMNEINSLHLQLVVCIAAMEVCIFYQLVGCSILTILSQLNYDVNFKLSFFVQITKIFKIF